MNIIQQIFTIFTTNKHYSLLGAIWMVIAGMAFACINVITPYISQNHPITSGWIAFYQYLFAAVFILPAVFKTGIKKVLKTQYFMTHFWRIIAAVIGIQFWIKALSVSFPIGEGVALLMTSPLFASFGAFLFLRERFNAVRVIATLSGFLGALIILNPTSDYFSYAAFFPLFAAFFWAIYSLLIKYLSDKDHPLTMLTYLYILMIPINLIVAITHNFSKWNEAVIFVPEALLMLYLIALGLLTTIAQYAIAKAYSLADAIYIQPFDYLKLPLNTFLGWLFFGWMVGVQFWVGVIIMIVSILAITYHESTSRHN